MENRKIVIYAPVSGKIHQLEELKDGVFSDGMLGEGIYIEPATKEFYSPIDEGKLSLVTETKHAYYFEHKNGPSILMHIGLDTVAMNGTPFIVAAKVGDEVSLDTKIVSVDLKSIKSNNYATSSPIVLDTNEFVGWKFTPTKTSGDIKRGEAIGEFIYTKPEKEEDTKICLMKNFSQDLVNMKQLPKKLIN
ncbi:PTS sugar transporter subunit IIA [[Acholeplasma] multilocale]|uniref:PTS sugar transporter subunit IIA n=1 Tax=[Acholeplasma] multilocale TaxID=264638 RepID=UPI0006853FF5|nr:PTS glucose transporter subunit IIA [[Acholeplasma] multilocale]